MIFWLLVPHALSAAAFVAAGGVMTAAGTNRTSLDLWLGTTGYVTGAAAVLASVVAAGMFPYSTATTENWFALAAHVGGLLVIALLGFGWLAMHIA